MCVQTLADAVVELWDRERGRVLIHHQKTTTQNQRETNLWCNSV